MTHAPALTPTRLLVGGVLIAAAAATVACAGGPPGRAGGPPTRTALFISPFGEPFMAEPGQPWPVADWVLGADGDLDGAITFAEFAADGRRWFDALDRDRSGALEPVELADYEAGLRTLTVGAASGGGRRDGPRPGGGARPAPMGLAGPAPQNRGGPPGGAARPSRRAGGGRSAGYGPVAEAGFFNLPQPAKAADVNVDQRVTSAEWATATERWFVALDTDRDGRLTLAGLPRTPLQARVEGRRS